MMDRRRWILAILAFVASLMIADVSRNGAGFINGLGAGVTLDVEQQLPTAHADLRHEFDVDQEDRLYLDVRGGRATVTGADTDVVTAEAKVAIFASSMEAATAHMETMRLDGTVKAGVLQPVLHAGKTKGVSRTTVYWTITMPHQMAVHVDSSLGAVNVTDVDNVVTVGGSGGVSAARIGSLEGTLRGGTLEADDVTGDVAVKVNFGATRLSRIGGNVHLSGDNGAMQVTGVGGDVVIGPSNAIAVSVGDVGGALAVEQTLGSLLAVDIDGPVTATTTAGDVEITPRTAAPMRVHVGNGSVTLRIPGRLWSQYSLSAKGALRPRAGYENFVSAYGDPNGPHNIDVKAEYIELDVADEEAGNAAPFRWSEGSSNFGWEYEMNIGP